MRDVLSHWLRGLWDYLSARPWSFVIIAAGFLVVVAIGSLAFYQKSSTMITRMLLFLVWFLVFVLFVVALILIRRGVLVLW